MHFDIEEKHISVKICVRSQYIKYSSILCAVKLNYMFSIVPTNLQWASTRNEVIAFRRKTQRRNV